MAFEDFRLRFGKALNELIGTAMLLMIIQLSVAGAVPGAPLVIGLGLVALVYAGAPISGAHYNPAVSLSFFIRGKMTLHEMLMYWVFQVAGGFVGALLGGAMIGKFAVFAIGDGYHFVQAFLAEFVFTALLCFVVLAVATNSKVEGNMYYSLAIGFVVYAGASTVGPISGGAFNPAVALGLVLVRHFWKIAYLLLVIVANLLGAVAGTILFYLVAPDEFENFGDEVQTIIDDARNRGTGIVDEARHLLPSAQ